MASIVCEKHDLRYDPEVSEGCVICQRERREATPAPSSPRWPMFVVLAALVAGVGVLVYFLVVRKKGDGGGSAATSAPRAQALGQPDTPLPAADYLPLAVGNTWTYEVRTKLGDDAPDRETRELTTSEWKAPDDQPAFVLRDENRGLLNADPMMYANRGGDVVSFGGFFGGARTQFDDGPFVDLPAHLGRGASWRYDGRSSGRPFELDSSLAGIERVTVPAGTFECIRVERTLPALPEARISVDYAKNVGVVRVDGTRPATPLVPPATFVWTLVRYRLAGSTRDEPLR